MPSCQRPMFIARYSYNRRLTRKKGYDSTHCASPLSYKESPVPKKTPSYAFPAHYVQTQVPNSFPTSPLVPKRRLHPRRRETPLSRDRRRERRKASSSRRRRKRQTTRRRWEGKTTRRRNSRHPGERRHGRSAASERRGREAGSGGRTGHRGRNTGETGHSRWWEGERRGAGGRERHGTETWSDAARLVLGQHGVGVCLALGGVGGCDGVDDGLGFFVADFWEGVV